VDEAQADASLLAFRASLREWLRTRNIQAVAEIVDADFDSGRGPDTFRRNLSSGTPESSYWTTLISLLELGGAFTTTRGAQPGRREFCAPYIYSKYTKPVPNDLSGEIDPWVVVVDKAPVRRAPSQDSAVLTYMSRELVKMTGEESPGPPPVRWRGVVAPDGRLGWIAAEQVRNAEDYRACFVKKNSTWIMTAFDRGGFPW
jgi:hypothetical protein